MPSTAERPVDRGRRIGLAGARVGRGELRGLPRGDLRRGDVGERRVGPERRLLLPRVLRFCGVSWDFSVGSVLAVLRLIWSVIAWVLGRLGRGPDVVFDSVHPSPLWSASGVQIYDVTQVWFRNRPLRATASEVTARIEFFDRGSTTARLAVHGQWAITTAPGHVGFTATAPTTDIPAGHTPVKLLVILKPRADSSAHAYAAENIHARPDGRHADFELPAGEYRMRLPLAGPNVERTCWF